jgi:hypothetical protein
LPVFFFKAGFFDLVFADLVGFADLSDFISFADLTFDFPDEPDTIRL